MITVNNTGYQAMIDLRREHVAANPQRYPPDMRGCSQYDIPLLLHPGHSVGDEGLDSLEGEHHDAPLGQQ